MHSSLWDDRQQDQGGGCQGHRGCSHPCRGRCLQQLSHSAQPHRFVPARPPSVIPPVTRTPAKLLSPLPRMHARLFQTVTVACHLPNNPMAHKVSSWPVLMSLLRLTGTVELDIPYSMLFRIDEELPHKREIARITPKCSHNY